jgi:hypothetical protein
MPITSKDAPGNKPAKAEGSTEAAAEQPAETPKTSKAAAAVYVAKQTGITTIDGASFQFRSGVTHVTADDPAYKAHPELFSPVADKARPVVEQATKAPGEKRGEK